MNLLFPLLARSYVGVSCWLQDGLRLRLHDNSTQYESLQIYPDFIVIQAPNVRSGVGSRRYNRSATGHKWTIAH
jgi:hypothetical protein